MRREHEVSFMVYLPRISIVTGTLNPNLKLFDKVLRSVKNQHYPQDKIEHLVMDGGSTNGCRELARRYGCIVVVPKGQWRREQIRPALGIMRAKGKLILILESDNILAGKDWLRKMVKPFLDNDKVVCSFSAYNAYEKDMSLTTRYCGLFGSPDPTLYYLKKTEKIRMDQSAYDKGTVIKETEDYWLVRFDKENLPTLGDNGHMFRKSAMMEVLEDPKTYTHTDAFAQMVRKGHNDFAAVKNSLIHVMNPDVLTLVNRRVEVKERYTDDRRGWRHYLVFNWRSREDRWNICTYIFFSLTFIQPLMVSIRGYLKIRDSAWFLHPVICFLMVVAYGWSEVVFQTKRFLIGLRLNK